VLNEKPVTQTKSFDVQSCLEAKIDDLALGQFDAYRREAVNAKTIAAESTRPLSHEPTNKAPLPNPPPT
jgi:ATP-dependent DNA helicase RecG